MPGAGVGGGVRALAPVDSCGGTCERVGEFQIGRSIENRIGRRHEHHGVHGSCVQISGELRDVRKARQFRLIALEAAAFADVSEGKIDREGEVLDRRRLAGSGKHCGPGAAGPEIGRHFPDPSELLFISDRRDVPCRHTELAGELGGHCGNHARSDAQAVIGHAAGKGIGGFDCIEPVHRPGVRSGVVAPPFRLASVEKNNV